MRICSVSGWYGVEHRSQSPSGIHSLDELQNPLLLRLNHRGLLRDRKMDGSSLGVFINTLGQTYHKKPNQVDKGEAKTTVQCPIYPLLNFWKTNIYI